MSFSIIKVSSGCERRSGNYWDVNISLSYSVQGPWNRVTHDPRSGCSLRYHRLFVQFGHYNVHDRPMGTSEVSIFPGLSCRMPAANRLQDADHRIGWYCPDRNLRRGDAERVPEYRQPHRKGFRDSRNLPLCGLLL